MGYYPLGVSTTMYTPLQDTGLTSCTRLLHASHMRSRSLALSRKLGRSSRKQKLGEDEARQDFPSCRHARHWRLQRRLSLARLAGLLLGRRPGLLEASPALAACSLEAAMLGAAGAGGEAALVARLNLALVLADARRRCDAGLAPALPLIHEVLT